MPILIIDSADQCMTSESAKLLYQDIRKRATELEIQTIFLSKDKLVDIHGVDCIDISSGLNKFHRK